MHQYPIIDGRAFEIDENGKRTLRIFAADLAEEADYIFENNISRVNIETLDPVALYRWHEQRITGGEVPEFRKMPSAEVDLSPLRKCKHIEMLHLEGNLVNAEVLAELSCLHTLSIDNESRTNPVRIDMLPNLKELWIHKYGKNILGLPASTGLESVRLWNYAPKRRNLTEFEKLKNLRELSLIQVRIDTLEGIERLLALRSFEIYYSRSLSDISALKKCPWLENIVLERVPKIKRPSKNEIVW